MIYVKLGVLINYLLQQNSVLFSNFFSKSYFEHKN